MADKKSRKGNDADKPKSDKKKSKSDSKKSDKKAKADKKKSAAPEAEPELEAENTRPVLTEEDAIAMAEALVEMFNEGAENPVAFFVSGDDALGRELIQLQGGEMDDMDGLVPVVLDAAQVRRYAMLTIADEMIWRRGSETHGSEDQE